MSAAAIAFEPDEDEATRVAPGLGGLDTAFDAFVKQDGSPESGMPADEWFVGVNGSPMGPIRLSDLRAKAASGAVTLESLVWRDGYEDWRPLKTFPELIAVVEESLSNARASMTPFVPSVARPSASSSSSASLAPKPSPTLEAKPATAPVEVKAPAPVPAPAAVTGSALVTDEIVPVQRPGVPYAALVAIGVALALGLVLGFVIFSRQSEPVVQYVQVPAQSGSAAPVPSLENAAPAPPPAVTAEGEKKTASGGGATKSGSGALAAKGSSQEPEKPGSSLSGLKGLSGLGPSGPSGPSGGVTTPSTGSSQLDGAQVQSTVSRYTGSVKRSCWQPALDSRDPNAPTSARVVVTITVAGSGSVQNVTTSGDPRGYPGLANCIAGRVRGWQFPPSSGTTTVNVPFVFAAQ